MSEEQACLVRPRTDSETSSKLSFGSCTRTMTYTEGRLEAPEAAGEPGHHVAERMNNLAEHAEHTESGELIDADESSALAQFHEDALRQAGCGIAQLRVLLATSLCVCSSSIELSAIPYILPSAELEMCILPHEKCWLVSISLLGLSLGAAAWGVLASRGGRRRALLSALAVNALFSTVAAFMPTYGTAMCARFCSAIGSGGIVPTVFSYLAEFVPRSHRRRALAPLILALALGGVYAGAVARALLPYTAVATHRENREHFSAWHRYLLLCTLPILAALVCLVWTLESPRYLLDAGREVDACAVYQKIHRSNQSWCARSAGAPCRLGELALPGKRAPRARHDAKMGAGRNRTGLVRSSWEMYGSQDELTLNKNDTCDDVCDVYFGQWYLFNPIKLRPPSLRQCWQALCQLLSGAHRRTSLTVGGTLLCAVSLQFYLAAYVPLAVQQIESAAFEVNRKIIREETFQNQVFTLPYNMTLENIEYANSTFENYVFRDMFLSHVRFRNCTFLNVTFSNIQTSYTSFEGCTFVNSSIIDTDVLVSRDMDSWTYLNNTWVRGIHVGCRRPDLTWRLGPLYREQLALALATGCACAAALLPAAPPVALSLACALLSPALFWARTETALYCVQALLRFCLTLLVYAACVACVEAYPAHLRCTAHGLLFSLSLLGALAARALGLLSPSHVACAGISTALSLASAAVSQRWHAGHANLL